MLCLNTEFGKVVVLTPRTRPVACEGLGVSPCWLSIKLDGQQVYGDRNVRVDEAMHVDGRRKERRLQKIFVLCQRQKRSVKVAVGQEDDCVLAHMGTKGEDAGYGCLSCRQNAIMVCTEATLDAGAIRKRDKSHDEVVGVWDRVYVDRGVAGRRIIGKGDNRGRTDLGFQQGESTMYPFMGPREVRGNAEGGERSGEDGSEGSGDQGWGGVNRSAIKSDDGS